MKTSSNLKVTPPDTEVEFHAVEAPIPSGLFVGEQLALPLKPVEKEGYKVDVIV